MTLPCASGAGALPEGFALIGAGPGFVRLCGDFYIHAEQPIVAALIAPEHLNPFGIAHGGMLVTLADSAMNAVLRRDFGILRPVTVGLSVDFLGTVRQGDWAQASVTLHKTGKRIANASCMVTVADRPVLRVSGVFMMPEREQAPPCT